MNKQKVQSTDNFFTRYGRYQIHNCTEQLSRSIILSLLFYIIIHIFRKIKLNAELSENSCNILPFMV